MNMKKQKVLVGLSGGVDSAVTAHLLLQQGYDVTAGFMINYREPENPHCSTRIDQETAKQVADFLKIPFLNFDFTVEYEDRIINYIYEGYKKGITPNPDVFCNNLIKFDLFLEYALIAGFDYIATGHYAQIIKIDNTNTLFRGIDPKKDQSYFLSRLNQHQLDHALLPLGTYTKEEIRVIAKDINLPNANRPDSQGLCFIGNIPMSEFLRKKLPEQKGDILDQSGKKVGTHNGARFYTLGQRHQLFLPFKAYVTKIDVTNNIITVGNKYDENLLSDTVKVTDRVWTGSEQSPEVLDNCLMKIRYRQEPAIEAKLIHNNNSKFTFSIPETRGITPGQIAVAYTEDRKVLGSGIII
ncbi:tRNA-specific 2-thiouridylase MnmA [candidate division SR1 bacterium Aalborg_AAW-1]|nr:tRNA-specific 2-thiouridylase MnmA [candidate division SR1 bacterium Aalborg_AAW-1]